MRAPLIDPADRMMLSGVQIALENPFRDPVRVCGQLMPRKLARQIERQLLRLRVLERKSLESPLSRDGRRALVSHASECPAVGGGDTQIHEGGVKL